jgi:gliding motility-associated-like protein
MICKLTQAEWPLRQLLPKTVLILFTFFGTQSAFSQSGLVVNEISQGATAIQEYAELVVVGPPCGTVDIRGWILDDNNGIFVDCAGPNSGALSGTGIAPGHIRFSFNPIWQEVPVGTIILVYASDPNDPGGQANTGGLTPDFTDANCDFIRVCPLNASANPFFEMDVNIPFGSPGCCPNGAGGNPAYSPATYVPLNNTAFAGITGVLGMANGGDAFQVRDASGNFFHGLSFGNTNVSGCFPTPQFDGGPFGLHLTGTGGNSIYHFINNVSDDFYNVSNFTNGVASTEETPGAPNSCENAQWIGSLRRPPESAFSSPSGNCLPNPSANVQIICPGQQIVLSLPNTNTCTSDSYGWSISGSGGVNLIGNTNSSTITIEGVSPGTVDVVITATVDNSLLYSQGGCSGPTFEESLTFLFPIVVEPGPTANSTTLNGCNTGGGQGTFDLTSVDNLVNGGSGNPVSWFLDANGSIPIANPMNFTTTSTTVYAVVTDPPCSSAPVPVTLNVFPQPNANPGNLTGCDDGSGTAIFDLTLLDNTVNGNNPGLSVTYYLDPAGTNPVPNPTAFPATNGTILYATTSNGFCESAVVPITLTVIPGPTPANSFISVSPLFSCGTTTVNVTFTFPSPGPYEVTMEYGNTGSGYQTFTQPIVITGQTFQFTISETTEFILTEVGLSNNPACSEIFSNPIVVTAVVADPPMLEITGDTLLCIGQSVSLDTVVTDTNNPGTVPVFFFPTPVPGNEVGPLVNPGANTTYFAIVDFGPGCSQTLPFTIVVQTGGQPMLGQDTLCDSDPLYDLTQLEDPAFPTGIWSGPGVIGNEFDAAGQNGNVELIFTPTGGCAQPDTTFLTVEASAMPVLLTDTLCALDPLLDLTTLQDPSFPTGTWSGPGVTGTDFDPAGQNGPTTLTFTSDEACVSVATTDMLVNPADLPILGADTLCTSDPILDLTTLQDPNFPTGTWSGPGVTGTDFDPSSFGTSQTVTLAFLATGTCVDTAFTDLLVQVSGTPVLQSDTLCENDPLYDLTQLQDTNFPNGAWTGPGVTGTDFDPAGQNGLVELVFTPVGDCTLPDTTTVLVQSAQTPILSGDTLCESGGIISLVPYQDPNFLTGVWSGTGVTNDSLDPTGLSGVLTLTFNSTEDCVLPATAAFEVVPALQPVLLADTICENNGPLDLTGLEDPGFPNGIWSGPGVSSDTFDPTGLNGSVSLTFTPDSLCFLPATTDILVNTPPVVIDQVFICDPGNTEYTVTLTLSGGDPSSYTVDGNPIGGNTFTSGVIPSGGSYSFLIDDANGCGPVTFSGSYNCNCISDAGSFGTVAEPLTVCAGDDWSVGAFHNNDEVLDGNDILLFVLHDNPGPVLGAIIETSPDGNFMYPVGAIPFQTYYVSVVVGNDDGSGGIDLTDPCLSVLPGLEIVFYQPNATYTLGGTLCPDECFNWGIEFQGFPPYTLTFATSGGTQDSVTVFQSDTTLSICPADYGFTSGTFELTPQALTDANCVNTFNSPTPLTVEVLPNDTLILNDMLCPGTSITVNGTVYDEGMPSGTEVLSGLGSNGCDSIIVVDLTFFPPVVDTINSLLCAEDTLVVNGMNYTSANPSGTETILGGAVNGCDSTIVVDLTFLAPVDSLINPILCVGDSVIVNNTVYHQTNPSGVEVISNGSFSGCDSTVVVDLSFFPVAQFNLDTTLCNGDSLVVNGTVYDALTPVGTEILPGAAFTGCDSLLSINLSFFPPATSTVQTTLCPNDSLVINGVTYNVGNPTGTELLPGAASTGCDSTVVIDLSFFPLATGSLDSTLCEGEFLVINGTTYDQNNTSGTETLLGATANGCDSILTINLTFEPNAVTDLSPTLCEGESLTVGTTTFDASFPMGSVVLPAANGCDSTVNVDLSFFPLATFQLDTLLCLNGSITVNGTQYDQSNPTGTEVFPNGSFTGCDSLVTISLSFIPPPASTVDTVLCPGEFILVNGVIYDASNPSGTEILPGASYQGCDSLINVDVDFYPPAAGLVNDQLCSDEFVVVNGTTYDINTPSGVEILPGSSQFGCDSTVTIDLSFFPPAIGVLDTLLCDGDAIFINGTLYDQSNSSGSELFPGISINGCDSLLNINLSFLPPVEFFITDTLVIGSSITVNGTVYDASNPAGIEVVLGGAANGCDSTIFVDITFEEILADLTVNSPTCFGFQDGTIVIDTIIGGKPPYSTSLDGLIFTPQTSYPVVLDNLGPGIYDLIIEDADGAVTVLELTVPEKPLFTIDLGDDEELLLGESIELEAQSNLAIASILWTPPTYLDCDTCIQVEVMQPLDRITYTVTAFDEDGCPASDRITIDVQKDRELYIPNIFSPNFDGVNDFFYPFGGDQVSEVQVFQVFDRWGNLLYQASNFQPGDPTYGWDGNFRGEAMNPAVYVYYMEVVYIDGETEVLKGDITLVR